MGPMQDDPTPWRRLAETLAGSFAARGLLASDFTIKDSEGEKIGTLTIHGLEGADLQAGDLAASIERLAPAGYTMLSRGAKLLSAEPAGAMNTPEIRCLDRLYRGRLSLLRNTAEACPEGGEVTVRITGGLTNRNYEAVFDAGDAGSLPVAFFLLYLTVALRRRAYLTAGIG